MAASLIAPRARLLCGTALTVLSALPVAAQDIETDVLSLDPIIVRQKDPLGGSADRATSTYVSEAELERASMGDLKDLFAGIASVSVGGAIPIAQKIYVNGVDMLKLAVQVDGVSQNNRIFHHVSANAFDPGLMKSVRVDPGVAPADAGPRALAGRVVMETVDAEDILDEGANFGGRARVSYDSNGNTAQGSLTLAGRSEGFEVLAYSKRATGDNYEDGDGVEMTGTGANLNANLLKFAYESDEGHRIELSGQNLTDREWRNSKANFGPSTDPLQFYDTERSIFALNYENTQGSGMWDPSFTLGRSDADVTKLNLGDDASGTTKTDSIVFKNTFHLSEVNTITAGIDYQKRETTVTGDYWSPVNGLATSATEESRFNGIFAQARLEPTANLQVSAGLRYDWMDFTGHDVGNSGTRFNLSESGASANLSVVYDVTEALSLRVAYSNVFGGVDLGDNFEFWRAFDYSALESSRAENIVIGADWARGDWRLGAEIFRTQIDDARDLSRGVVTMNDFESEGVNLAATYGWADGFARLTYSYSDATLNGEASSNYDLGNFGAPLGSVIAFEMQQELPQHNLLVGGSVEAALSLDAGGSYADQELPGYQVVNLFAEYAPPAWNGVTIRGSINNLFDEQYADRATYGAEFSDFNTLNEPGRNISVVATMRF
ncbi:TonB-dependent receptor [Epibacterium sp. SM1979]|uniref:TonB-dependent receptor n=1 Tax=Tritonibacter litoralis TaxID=2662264 RepID=A0A843YD32_9RHOB|nr:TonB-dependent receptor [Tritonibacter litoralis]MQQ07778.1 TonB-dependent receptor [Tritonibacter litoralis]